VDTVVVINFGAVPGATLGPSTNGPLAKLDVANRPRPNALASASEAKNLFVLTM